MHEQKTMSNVISCRIVSNEIIIVVSRALLVIKPGRGNTRRTGFCIGLAIACCVALAHGTTTQAGAPSPAKPQTAGCNFIVNSAGDDTTSNSTLTLREALLLVAGGTDATGLNRPLSSLAVALLRSITTFTVA